MIYAHNKIITSVRDKTTTLCTLPTHSIRFECKHAHVQRAVVFVENALHSFFSWLLLHHFHSSIFIMNIRYLYTIGEFSAHKMYLVLEFCLHCAYLQRYAFCVWLWPCHCLRYRKLLHRQMTEYLVQLNYCKIENNLQKIHIYRCIGVCKWVSLYTWMIWEMLSCRMLRSQITSAVVYIVYTYAIHDMEPHFVLLNVKKELNFFIFFAYDIMCLVPKAKLYFSLQNISHQLNLFDWAGIFVWFFFSDRVTQNREKGYFQVN